MLSPLFLYRKSQNFCCGEYSENKFGEKICHGVIKAGRKCEHDKTCEGNGYCDEFACKAAKDIDDACTKDNQCGSGAYCDNTCKLKIANSQQCKHDFHHSCISGACGLKDTFRTYVNGIAVPDYRCCETGSTFERGSWSYCAAVQNDQEDCIQDEHCVSDYCVEGKEFYGYRFH